MSIKRPYRVLLVLQDQQGLEAWQQLAQRIMPWNSEIHLRGLVVLPENQSLSEGALPARQWRDALRQVAIDSPIIDDQVRVLVDYQPMRRVLEEIQTLQIDLLIAQWMGPTDQTGGLSTTAILNNSPCDVVLVGSNWRPETGPVLLSLRGGPNISLGLQVAKALANDSSITIFHAADHQNSAPNLEMMMRTDPQIQRTVTAVSSITEGILHEASGHKSIVLGARLQLPDVTSEELSPVVQRLYENTDIPLVLVRAHHPEALSFHVPHRVEVLREDPSTRVDRWFAENTFHSHEFVDLRHLLTLKEKQGLTISVGLPALNEEATIGNVIHTLKTALMDDLPLVDEMVLIDSCSTDNTVAIAQEYGIPVVVHQEVLPEVGANRGKGEALWKSLYTLKGDIIVWVDTDITNIHPRFIYGLLGPLLKHPHIQYVKGFYQRPIAVDNKLQSVGGGRVTELVARPLLNLFYPELSGIIQPLSGEYAGRSKALEQLPFFSGYGVETGMLIDMLEKFSLDAIAQTDLEVRIHHNQPLADLSKMSFAILQVFMARLEKRFGVQMLDQVNRSMKIIVQEPERFGLEINQVGDVERPPMVTLPAYHDRQQFMHQRTVEI